MKTRHNIAIPVMLCVLLCCNPRGGASSLTPDRSELPLTAPEGASQTGRITFPVGTDPSSIVTSVDALWLSVEPDASSLEEPALEVTATSTGLEMGTYVATLTLSAPAKTSATVTVTFVVTQRALVFEPPVVTLRPEEEGSASTRVTLRPTTGNAVMSVSGDVAWLTPALSTAISANVTIDVNASGVEVVAHSGTVTATAPGYVDATLPVSMLIQADCMKKLEIRFKETSRLDLGWTGLGHNMFFPASVLTAEVTCPEGSPCGDECAITALLDNDVIPGRASNRRCTLDTKTHCAVDSDCAGIGACRLLLAPMSIDVGDGSSCLLLNVASDLTGATSLATGVTSISPIDIEARNWPAGVGDLGCPRCVAGACVGGSNEGGSCTVDGSSLFGDTSLDCPLASSNAIVSVTLPSLLSNTQTTWTLADSAVDCSGNGVSTQRCFCSSCNNVDAQGCRMDSDCPASGSCVAGANANKACTSDTHCPGSTCGGAPCVNDEGCASGTLCVAGRCSTLGGICGGRSCTSGEFLGSPCNGAGPCSGQGNCILPGRATAPNACTDLTCTGTSSTGSCAAGPPDGFCSQSSHVRCTDDNHCPSGETCASTPRVCWADNMSLSAQISTELTTTANPDEPAFGGLLCLPGGASPSASDAIGMPGPARFQLYTDVVVHN